MAKPKLKKRLVVRITAPLINRLKICADRDGRPLSSFVRKVLSDVVRTESATETRQR
jgi:predicted DNA binding CopG/RHH family protein